MNNRDDLSKDKNIEWDSSFPPKVLLLSLGLHLVVFVIGNYWLQITSIRNAYIVQTLKISLLPSPIEPPEIKQHSLSEPKPKKIKTEPSSKPPDNSANREITKVKPRITERHLMQKNTLVKQKPKKKTREKIGQLTGGEKYEEFISQYNADTDYNSSSENNNDCTNQQKSSEIRICQETKETHQNGSTSPVAGSFVKAFSHLNSTEGFKKDMAKRESLVQIQEQLYNMIESDGPESGFVTSQRLELSREIARIDKKYSTVDFFNIGMKVTKKLIEKSRE